MTIDTRFILSPPLNQFFINKDNALPLAAGTVTFYRDTARNTAKPVYQLTGFAPDYTFTVVVDPITLSDVGTFQNAAGDNIVIYYYPFEGTPEQASTTQDLYYIVCKDNNGNLQWTREAWPAGAGGGGSIPPVETGQSSLENQISNPQFTRMFLNEGFVTTFSQADSTEQTYPIAPGWDLIVTGANGTSVAVQRVAVPGSEKQPTSPAYVLDIVTSTGINSCRLRQRFDVNSGLWASTVQGSTSIPNYLAASITGIAFTTSQGVSMVYDASTGGSEIPLLTALLITDNYKTFNETKSAEIAASQDTNTGTNGYIDIFVVIPTAAHIRITSIQVIPLGSASVIPYDLQSSDRMQAYMGDYYVPRLEAKTIRSLLTAWDFPLNPAQLRPSGTMPASTGLNYIWDQTVAGDTANTATYVRSSVTGGFQVTTVTAATNAFVISQYLDGAQAKKVLGTRLSVNVFAYKGSAGNDVVMRVYLLRGTAASKFPTPPTGTPNPPLGTLSTSGVFSITAAGWAEIPRSNLDTAKATLSVASTNSAINNAANNYGFTGWEITNSTQIADTDKFAIIVTFAYTTAATVVTVNSVSVVPGDIPTRPALQTPDEVLRECQYYYEKSYDAAVAPGTITTQGQRVIPFPLFYNGTANFLIACSFTLNYQIKRSSPAVTFYAPTTTTSDRIYIATWSSGVVTNGPYYVTTADLAGLYSPVSVSTTAIEMTSGSSAALSPPISNLAASEGVALFQFVVDARLGAVL